jgi:hypothetical protein
MHRPIRVPQETKRKDDIKGMIRKSLLLIPSLLFLAFSGCIGWNPDQLFDGKPYTYIRGGDQFGRDQLANRWLVGEGKLPIQGRDANEVITLLGQPQNIQVRQHRVSEDWFFTYYKAYKTRPKTDLGSFLVRMYHSEVVDVVREPYTDAQPA